MNQGRSPSPEEKLLRLLRKKPKDALPEQSAPSTQETRVISGWSKRSPLGNTAAFRGVFFGPGLKRLNILFWICLGAELFYLLGSLVWSFVAGEDKKKPFLQESKPEVSVTSLRLLPLTSRLRPLDYYVGRVGSRQLFSGQMYTQEGAPRISKALDKVDISDFTLIGIMGGDSPEAIVESKKEQKSYYLKKGDWVGPFQVKEIKEGQVILQRDSELLELNL